MRLRCECILKFIQGFDVKSSRITNFCFRQSSFYSLFQNTTFPYVCLGTETQSNFKCVSEHDFSVTFEIAFQAYVKKVFYYQ